jgi:hypothetical protein
MVKVQNHQPYEAWLFSRESLSLEQRQALQAHLAVCQDCRQLADAWSQVHDIFQRVSQVQPMEGFAARWQVRAAALNAAEQRQKYRRSSWWTFAFAAGMAAVFLGLLMYHTLTSYSPFYFLFLIAYQVSTLLSLVRAVQDLATTLIGTVWTLVPPGYWAALASALALLSVLWIMSLRKLIGNN